GSSWIEVPYTSQLNIIGDKTISAWIYISTSDNASLPLYPTIVSKSNTTGYYPTYAMQLLTSSGYGSNQYKYCFFYGDGTNNYECDSKQLYTNYLNQWVCVVGTYNTATGESKIYFDGVLSDSLIVGPKVTSNSIYNDLYIGAAGTMSNCFFVGKIDEVAIYSRVLNNTEVVELCNESVGIKETKVNNNEILLYPNPAFNNLTIECQQKSTIEILNIQGQTILQQQLQQGKTDIDISSLAKGVYILRLYSNEKTVVTRIVKE
ncbi:MAG: LamG-like jellyroll fold domain-containing protein, partial [Bacteroidales bacterium]